MGFCFDQIFTVTFNQKRRPVFEGHSFPWSSELCLMEDWWLGDRQEWKRKIKEMGIGVEPSEPVKAFELAALRWSGGAQIAEVKLDRNRLFLGFENGATLQTLPEDVDEFSFGLAEPVVAEPDAIWSVYRDNCGVYIRSPEPRSDKIQG